MSQIPAPRAIGTSTNDYCALLPKQRFSHEAQGLILLFPATGLTGVPFEMQKGGSWSVVVAGGSDIYPRGGYHLNVGRNEIETAIELSIGAEVQTTFVHTPEEADALPDRATILTPSGTTFLKEENFGGEGITAWTGFLREPIGTDGLDLALHFPAKVLGKAAQKDGTGV